MVLIPFAVPRILQSQGPLQRLQTEHAARLAHYQELRDFYEGRHFTSGRRGRSSVVVNYARAIIDKHVSYAFARGVLLEGPDAAEHGPIDQALDQIAADTALARTLLQAGTNASVLGDAVLKIVWKAQPHPEPPRPAPSYLGGFAPQPPREDARPVVGEVNGRVVRRPSRPAAGAGEGGVRAPARQAAQGGLTSSSPSPAAARDLGQIRIINIDPGRFFPTFASGDPTDLREVAATSTISPAEAAERYQLHLARATELVETWTPTTFTVEVGNRTVFAGPNPYGFIPYIHVANLAPAGDPFGLSELEDIIPLNRELDERMSDQADVIRYHADPPVIFKGVREHSDLAVSPGTVWDIPDGADVQLLEWRGQSPAVQQHLERTLIALYDVAETPRSSFGDTAQAFSGVALETQLQPIVQRTLRRRIVWEAALQRLGRYALLLAEQFQYLGAQPGDFEPYQVRVHWLPMLPRDDDAEANRYIALTAAGLRSHGGAMELLGVEDPQAELARIRAEQEALGVRGEA